MTKKLKIILLIFTVCLAGAGVFYFSNTLKGGLAQTSLNSEGQSIVVLNPKSHPQKSKPWLWPLVAAFHR